MEANLLALDAPPAAGEAINVGTGRSISVRDLAGSLMRHLGRDELVPDVTGEYRAGDIRHCWADVRKARELLAFEARADREARLRELAEWVARETPIDRTEDATAELRARGLVR